MFLRCRFLEAAGKSQAAIIAAIAVLTLITACDGYSHGEIDSRKNEREALVFERLTSRGFPERVAHLFRQVPREYFIRPADAIAAYRDNMLEIGPGRQSWAPSDLAQMLVMADVAQYQSVLVVGAMGGYLESLLRLTPAFVTAVDHDCAYVDQSREAFKRYAKAANLSSKGDLVFICSQPLELSPETLKTADRERPDGFDRIIVPYSADWVPEAWARLLKPSGRIVVVVGNPSTGRVMVGDSLSTGLTWRQGPDIRMPRLMPSEPQNFYTQIAGEFTEPLVWPEPGDMGRQLPGNRSARELMDRAGEDPGYPGTDADDASEAFESESGVDDALGIARKTPVPGQSLKDIVPEEEPLLVKIDTEPARAGQKAIVAVSFIKNGAHVKVPQYPSAYLMLNAVSELGITGGTKYKTRELSRAEADAKGLGTSYYDEIPPIRAAIPIPAGTKPGSYPVEGTVFYFYCTTADDAGYCAIRKEKVSFALRVD